MGEESISNPKSERDGGGDVNSSNSGTRIMLNVYDLTPLNNYTVWFGFGIFHSGIEGEKLC